MRLWNRPDPRLSGGLLLVWTLVAFTPAVAQGDRALAEWTQRLRGPTVERILGAALALGDVEVTLPLAVLASVGLWAQRGPAAALTPLVAFAAGSALSLAGKLFLPHAGTEEGEPGHIGPMWIRVPYGYPSGHAFRVLFVADLVMTLRPFSRGWRAVRVGIRTAVAALMMLALVIMSIHWASQVVGGYLLAVTLLGIVTHRPAVAAAGSPAPLGGQM